MRVLVFGDSIVWGYSDSRGGWTDRLKGHYFAIDIKNSTHYMEPLIFNMGVGGDTTTQLISRLKEDIKTRRYKGLPIAFVVAIGFNDAAIVNGREGSNPKKYRQELEQILKMINETGEKVLFVGLTPVEDNNPHVNRSAITWKTERIKKFDNELRNFCRVYVLPFVSLWESFIGREAELLSDGLHPNNEGHELIFQLVRPELDKVLNT